MSEEKLRDWHRLFGLILADFFTGTGYDVEVEIDLSARRQLLDIVVVRKGEVPLDLTLPDGFDQLAPHNLITFKSHHEPLDDYALKELTGHYVNYRKQVSPSMNHLLPESDFRLFGICARIPIRLFSSELPVTKLGNGVYDCRRGTDSFRIVVIAELAQQEQNAMLHLFSASRNLVQFGTEHYHQRSTETSTLIHTLMGRYTGEGITMAYTYEDFRRDLRKEFIQKFMTLEERLEGVTPEEILKRLSPEEILKGLPPEERLKGLPPEERLKGLPPEERLKGLPPEERLKGLPPEERLKGLAPEELEQLKRYLDSLDQDSAPPQT